MSARARSLLGRRKEAAEAGAEAATALKAEQGADDGKTLPGPGKGASGAERGCASCSFDGMLRLLRIR